MKYRVLYANSALDLQKAMNALADSDKPYKFVAAFTTGADDGMPQGLVIMERAE
jgi:hypothetical protein